MKQLCARFYNETARIEQLVLLAGILADEALPAAARELLHEEELDILIDCFGELPAHVKEDIENGDPEAINAWLYESGKLGFLMQIATPVMTPTGANSSMYSWGHYRTKWVYGDTLDEALEKGFAWVTEQRTKEKTK